MVVSKQIELLSDGHFNIINITDQVREFVNSSGVKNGQALVYFQHTTGSVIIGEHETGIMADLQDMFERIIPSGYSFKHHKRAVDYNGHAHIRAALMPTSVTIPVINNKLAMGTYQEVLVIDDQVDQEPRYVILQVMGE